ncbi:hypothetical protein [Bacillus sp. E214]|uniref:SGNH/GDSL hydrolase family protein n=1 Tax=Bacillus sp. E214 TaxID=2587156 RepID=UPI0011DF228D|nr:hypothetical protein [Bacillus sp. E214]
MSPPKRFNNDNNIGLTITDYSEAMKKVADKFSLIFIDVNKESGINYNNLKENTIDGIHLNIKGYKKVARLIDSQLEYTSPKG